MAREAILDSIVKDWAAPITPPDVYEAMQVHAIEFGKWLNKKCDHWGDEVLYANGDGKSYSIEDIYNKYTIEQQNK